MNAPAVTPVLCPKCDKPAVLGRVMCVPFPCCACGSMIVNNYYDLEMIGSGAMGDVYRAVRVDWPGKSWALKIPRATDGETHRRFQCEIAASARLRHENIVHAVDYGDFLGFPYLVMELEHGQVLEWLVKNKGVLSPDQVARMLRDVASGLALAERLEIVNRDIKPENLFVLDDGRTKILDYGLALFGGHTETTTRTTPGTRLGTPAFMSPEQAIDCSRVTILADIYSLGCTAYFALAGVPPFLGNVKETLQQHANNPRPMVTSRKISVPSGLERLIQRMMAIAPEQRPSPRAVVQEIDGWHGVIPEAADVVAVVEATPLARPPWPAPERGEGGDERTSLDGFAVGGLAVVGEVVPDDGPWEGEVVEDQPQVVELPVSAIVEESPQIQTLPVASEDRASPGATERVHETASNASRETVRSTAPAPRARERKGQRSQPRSRRRLWTLMGVFAVVAMICVGGVLVSQRLNPGPSPDDEWQALQDDYKLHRFKQVEKLLAEFGGKYPTDPRVVEIPFFSAMCQAGPHVYTQTAKPEEGLRRIREVFHQFRDTEQYSRYCADLFEALEELTNRWLSVADKTSRREALAGAEEALSLLSTVSKAMSDDWVPRKVAELSGKIDAARQKLQVAWAKEEFQKLLKDGQDQETAGDSLDVLYAQLKSLADRFPALGTDAALQKEVDALRAREAGRVRYVPREEAETTEPVRQETVDPSLFVVWDQLPTGEGRTASTRICVAFVQGVLYAFRETGEFVWARRLGIDATRLPVPLEPSTAFPAAFIAVSTIDNSLVALDQSSGEVLWKFRAGAEHDLSAPLTISRWRATSDQAWRVRGLLPTSQGEVHVLDLVQGRPIGLFRTGFAMTVGGTYDPQRQLAFFPADSNRVFALDPAVIEGVSTAAARGVIFTKHGSGTLRSPPALIGPYLILTEAADLDQSRVKAFFLREGGELPQDPNVAPVAEFALDGWSWFETPQTADRVTVITDAGQLGVFGVNLDTPSEALFPLVTDDRGQIPRLPISSPYRALAIHSEENLLWIMAGGSLRQLALDVLNQRVATIWPKPQDRSESVGIPLHEATLDRQSGRMYLTTRTLDGSRVEFSAVNVETGERVWGRQLGVYPLGGPLVHGTQVVLVDHSGRLVTVDVLPEKPGGPRVAVQTETGGPPEGIERLHRMRAASGAEYLVGVLRGGRGVAMRDLSRKPTDSSWRIIELASSPVLGTPLLQGSYLVAACADGRLHRIALEVDQQDRNAQTIAWSEAVPHANESPGLFALDESSLLLVHRGTVRWLRHVAGEVGKWIEPAPPFQLAAESAGIPAINDKRVFLSDVAGGLYELDQAGNTRKKIWSASGRITAGPCVYGDRLVVMEDERTLVAFDLQSTAEPWQPAWRMGPLKHRICGEPQGVGRGLIVTDEGGGIQGVRLADGKTSFSLTLPAGVVPTAPAVLLERMLVAPLADGSVYPLPLDTRTASGSGPAAPGVGP